MSTSQSHTTSDDVQAIIHCLSTDFDRERKFGPRQIVVTLMTMIKLGCGYQRGLDAVHQSQGNIFGWGKKAPTAGAFCRARQNLTVAEMMVMYEDGLNSPVANAARQRWLWKGHRMMAADGVRYLLPASDAVIDEWHRPLVTNGEAYQPQLLQVALWDVGAIQPVAWVNMPCRGKGYGERAGLFQLLDRMKPGDVLLLDRGFPSRRLLFELRARGIHFIIRMNAGTDHDFAEVARFLSGRKKDVDAIFTYADPDSAEPLTEKLRLVRRHHSDGTKSVLVTDLLDRKTISITDLFDAYRLRWGIENAFRDLKIRYAGEDFHGTSPQFIEQEIIALMLLMLMESLVEETVLRTLPVDQQPNGDQKNPKRCNRGALGDRLMVLIDIAIRERVPSHLRDCFARGIAACAAHRQAVRRPRSQHYPRVCKSQYGRWRMKRGKTSYGRTAA